MIAHLSVRKALAELATQLEAAGIEGAMRDARLLLARAMQLEPSRLMLRMDDPLSTDHADALDPLLKRRLRREPMSHILGHRLFYGRSFEVTPDVLDPRPETETLVAEALKRPFSTILDLGTGTGCILLTLLAERQGATGIGVDRSAAALEVAGRNADRLGVAARCGLLVSDWFECVTGCFDLIVSNPPYIAAWEMATLAPELGHEPRIALTDGGDGLSAYRIIAAGAGAHLKPGGCLMVEIGWQQGEAVQGILREAGFGAVCLLPDLEGRDRVILAQDPAQTDAPASRNGEKPR